MYTGYRVKSVEPRLPPDLERLIFETCAVSLPSTMAKLMLVAWRVKAWIERLLYRVLFVPKSEILHRRGHLEGFHIFSPAALRLIETNSHGFLHRLVRAVLIAGIDRNQYPEILTTCSATTHLRIDLPSSSHLPELAALKTLRRLTIGVGMLFTTITGTGPLFPHLTHLELLESYLPNPRSRWALDADDVYDKLQSRFPSLTHLALTTTPHNAVSAQTIHADAKLRCIVYLVTAPIVLREGSPYLHDRRFVCVPQATDHRVEWLRGADGGEDFWTRAEAFIEARREGAVDASEYNMPHPSLWTNDWVP
ncbi:hypothetical protein C8R46DRAFT_1192951 [Mycena filopes]|nr:hypothetical protein C8R46DRAFT_1192951 [Mycena filopes]